MLEYLRRLLREDYSRFEEISAQTGVSEEVLRRFANGISVPDGLEIDGLVSYFGLGLSPTATNDLLPLEAAASQGIQILFKQELAEAGNALRLALRIIGNRPDGRGSINHFSKRRGTPPPVINICLGIYTKITKHFRAIIALSEIGLGEDSNVLARAMFEATLALAFILRPRVPLLENGKKVEGTLKGKAEELCPKCKHVVRPEKAALPLKRLSAFMRAKLYFAHQIIKTDQKLKEWVGMKITIPSEVIVRQKESEKGAKRAKKMIGPGWLARQKEKKTFTGIHIKDLATSYKLQDYYSVVYHQQSNIAHGGNALDYVSFSQIEGLKLNLGPNPEGIDNVLLLGTTLMMWSADLMNKRFGLGFEKELHQVKVRLKGQAKKR